MGDVHRSSRPGPRLLEGLSGGSGALQDFFQVYYLGPPAHPLAQGWVISGPSKRMHESASSLTFQLMTTPPPSATPPHLPSSPPVQVLREEKKAIRHQTPDATAGVESASSPATGFRGTSCGALAASGAPELKGWRGEPRWVHQRGAGAWRQQPYLTALAPEAFTRS